LDACADATSNKNAITAKVLTCFPQALEDDFSIFKVCVKLKNSLRRQSLQFNVVEVAEINFARSAHQLSVSEDRFHVLKNPLRALSSLRRDPQLLAAFLYLVLNHEISGILDCRDGPMVSAAETKH
jgi:hypothetical protein